MKYIYLATVLLLAGCKTLPAVIESKVPVIVSCIKTAPVRPTYDVEKLTPTANDGEKILALAADWPRGRKYEGELEAALTGCK